MRIAVIIKAGLINHVRQGVITAVNTNLEVYPGPAVSRGSPQYYSVIKAGPG